MKEKIAKALEEIEGKHPTRAKKILRALLANYSDEVRGAFASLGGTAGRGSSKRRSPEFYKELAAKGVAARKAKREAKTAAEQLSDLQKKQREQEEA